MRHTRIMKIPLIWLALTLLMSVPMVKVGVGSPETTFSVSPSKVTAWPLDTPGGHGYNTFIVEMTVTDVSNLFGWGLWLHWDTTKVNLTGVYEGPFIKGPFVYETRHKVHSENITVNNPTLAYDGDSSTYASFTYAQTSIGNYTLETPGIPLYEYPIDHVDLKMRYSAEAAVDDEYRIVYYLASKPDDIRTLVDWTSAGQSLGTYTWADVANPWGMDWIWMDVSNINFMIETRQTLPSDNKEFRVYEAWIEVAYGRDMFHPAPDINYATGYMYDGSTAMGELDGVDGTGVVAMYKFVALTSAVSSPIEFAAPGPMAESKLVDPDGVLLSHTNVDSTFIAPPLRVDINADGMVDIFDLVMVAIGFGKTSSDENWDHYKDADVAPTIPDGKIDIEDLVAVALQWGLGPYL